MPDWNDWNEICGTQSTVSDDKMCSNCRHTTFLRGYVQKMAFNKYRKLLHRQQKYLLTTFNDHCFEKTKQNCTIQWISIQLLCHKGHWDVFFPSFFFYSLNPIWINLNVEHWGHGESYRATLDCYILRGFLSTPTILKKKKKKVEQYKVTLNYDLDSQD